MKSKVLVWGIGKSAHTVAAYIKKAFSDCMDFVGFYVQDYQKVRYIDGESVFTMGELLANNFEIADILIIPNPGKLIADIICDHRVINNKKVLFVSAENIRNPHKDSYFVEIDTRRPWLNGFEYHVADHCNLNCKGCGHCANLFNKASFGDIASYEKDLKRISELYDGVGLIRLLGGEPLLNDDLIKFVEITRKYFKDSEIHIVTNGILLLSKDKNFLRNLKMQGVIIDISVYPPIAPKLPLITERLQLNQIEFNIMPVEQFYKRFSLTAKFDKVTSYKDCGTATCHTLYNGKIAPCIVPFSTDKLRKEYNVSISVDGWIDLYEDGINGEQINQRLKQPIGLCAHCNPQKVFFDWEQRGYSECKLEDWICD